MINPKSLRLGSVLNYDTTFGIEERVLDIDDLERIIKWPTSFIHRYSGIPITPERLEKASFVMSVLLNYVYVEQTEIGDGVDYRFKQAEPDDDDLNFLDDYHYVEISGILQESKTNTLKGRIKDKHDQIKRGGKRDKSSSVVVTLFNSPVTVKEIHK